MKSWETPSLVTDLSQNKWFNHFYMGSTTDCKELKLHWSSEETWNLHQQQKKRKKKKHLVSFQKGSQSDQQTTHTQKHFCVAVNVIKSTKNY